MHPRAQYQKREKSNNEEENSCCYLLLNGTVNFTNKMGPGVLTKEHSAESKTDQLPAPFWCNPSDNCSTSVSLKSTHPHSKHKSLLGMNKEIDFQISVNEQVLIWI